MIELKVADYCHNCKHFMPVCNNYAKITDNTNKCTRSTIIECKHAIHCKNIEKYIRKELNIDD